MDVNTRENKYSRVSNTNTQGQHQNLPLLCFFSSIWLAKNKIFFQSSSFLPQIEGYKAI